MDIASAVLWVVGGLAVLLILLFGFAVFVVVAMLLLRAGKKKAQAAGVDFTDGIDDRERAILLGMITKHRTNAVEQAVAVDMVNAAQAALQKAKP